MLKASFSKTLIGITIGIMLALLIVPATRWMVLAQLGYVFETNKNFPGLSYDHNKIAADMPNDCQVQIASAIWSGPHDTDLILPRLRLLARRFPNNPTIYATLLRWQCRRPHFGNAEGDYLLYGTPPANLKELLAKKPASQEYANQFNSDALAGERIDPNNAFFTFMRADALFALKRNDEAIALIHASALKNDWNDYAGDEAYGEWRIADRANGERSGLLHAVIMGSTLLPHYSQIRHIVRIATYQAVILESQGKTQEGLNIRFDILRIGSLMRSGSPSEIGSLVGMAISREAIMRPGGSPALDNSESSGDKQEAQAKRAKAFDDFLSRTGHADVINQVHLEWTQMQSVRNIFQAKNSQDAADSSDLFLMCKLWIGVSVILCGFFWIVLMTAAAIAHSRIPFTQINTYVNTGKALVLGFICGVIIYFCLELALNSPEATIYFIFGGLVLLIGTLVFFYLRTRKAGIQIRSATVVLLSVLPAGLIGVAFGACAISQGKAICNAFEILGLIGSETSTNNNWHAMLITAPIILIPIFVLIAAALYTKLRKIAGFSSTLIHVNIITLCLLACVYGIMNLCIVRQDRIIDQQAQHTLSGEGIYAAKLAGKPWPGRVDFGNI